MQIGMENDLQKFESMPAADFSDKVHGTDSHSEGISD
jgi:hypothetical protein